MTDKATLHTAEALSLAVGLRAVTAGRTRHTRPGRPLLPDPHPDFLRDLPATLRKMLARPTSDSSSRLKVAQGRVGFEDEALPRPRRQRDDVSGLPVQQLFDGGPLSAVH